MVLLQILNLSIWVLVLNFQKALQHGRRPARRVADGAAPDARVSICCEFSMVTNRETLIEAQQKPEEYRDLLVRVSGFSAYFHSLSAGFQNELINRTEQSFD